MTDQYAVVPECPAEKHNTLRIANRANRRCICPHAQQLREDYLRRRRVQTPLRPSVGRRTAPIVDPLPPVRGEPARELLAPYAEPPHLCVGEDPELWFSINPDEVELARDICSRCPMRKLCEQAATDNGWQGVWGESDDEQRRQTRGSWTRIG